MLQYDFLNQIRISSRGGRTTRARLGPDLLRRLNRAEVKENRLDHPNERLPVIVRLAILEEIHFLYETFQEVEIVRPDEILQDACRRGRCRCLAHRRHVIEAEVVKLGHVKLVQLVGADQGAEVVDLHRELLTRSPLIYVRLFHLLLSLNK